MDRRTAGLLTAVVALHLSVFVGPAVAATARELMDEADRLARPEDRTPAMLQRAVTLYQDAARLEPGNADIFVALANTALDLGDSVDRDALHWYEIGERAARTAIAHDARIAHAYFLVAATHGRAVKLRSLMQVSPRVVGELETFLRRALELDPHHARALHMMGALLRNTPFFLRGFLRGKASDAPRYLIAAVEAEPRFPAARLELADYYQSVGRFADARAQAEAVLDMTRDSRNRRWREKYRPAAEELLKTLAAR